MQNGSSPLGAGRVVWRALRLVLAWALFCAVCAVLYPPLGDGLRGLTATLSKPPQNLPIHRQLDGERLPPGCAPAAAPDTVQPDHAVLRREIEIDLRQGAVQVQVDAWFQRCSPRLHQVHETMERFDRLDAVERGQLREAVFGWVNLFRQDETSLSWHVVSDTGDQVRLRLKQTTPQRSTAQPAPNRVPGRVIVDDGFWRARATKLSLRTDADVGVWAETAHPSVRSDGLAEWELGPGPVSLLVTIVPAVVDTRDAPVHNSLLAVLEPARLALFYALPFVAVWWWARRTPAGAWSAPTVPTQVGLACARAVALVFTLAAFETIERLAYEGRGWLSSLRGVGSLSYATSLVKAAAIAVLLPVTGLGRATFADERRARGGAWPLGLLAAVALAAALVLLQSGDASKSPWGPWLSAHPEAFVAERARAEQLLAALLAAAVFAAWWVGAEMAGLWRGLVLAAVLLLATTAVIVVDRLVPSAQRPLLAALLAPGFGIAFGLACRRWLPLPMPPGRPWVWAIAGAALAVLLALPLNLARGGGYAWLLSSAVWSMLRWWQAPALALLVFWLARRTGAARSGALQDDVRRAGSVLLMIMFFWSAQWSWLTLAAAAATGVLLLQHWVFSPRRVRLPGPRRAGLLQQAITELATCHRLMAMQRGLAKGLLDKLGKGELTAAEAVKRRAEADDLLVPRDAAVRRAHCRGLLALNEGPFGDAWRRGRRGALVSSALALPWLLSYFAELANAQAPQTVAFAFSQLGTVALAVARWPALGFFFLYFYPHLRGYNGIQKGLSLTLALVLPAFVATLLGHADARDAWLSLVFWGLQVFICAMVLGVVLGDLGALRKAGKGARGLIEIYNLGTLAAWSSSLALAIGAAVATALATQAGSLFAAGLKLLLPEVQGTAK